MARYEAGETLASIARTYGCSPPAISYVVSRTRARQSGPEPLSPAASATEPQLVKATAGEGAAAAAVAKASPSHAVAAPAEPVAARADDRPRSSPEAALAGPGERSDGGSLREVNGTARGAFGGRPSGPPQARPAAPAIPANGDHRRRLHLSLGGTPPAIGNSHSGDGHAGERSFPVDRLPAESTTAAADRGGAGAATADFAEPRHASYDDTTRRNDGNGAQRRDAAGSFIDRELRTRVQDDITAFLQAFDAALVQDTQESRAGLLEATDRLLRAGARTRIELERLEARMPLTARDGGRHEPAWRHR